MLYAYCASHGVPHRKLGKLVVAADRAETAKIEQIAKQGEINGVEGLEIDRRPGAPRALEPELVCAAALRSPETGIVDSHAYMLALRGDLEDAGGMIAFDTPVAAIERRKARWLARFGGAEAGEAAFDAVVNAAGLGAQAIARAMPDYPQARVPRLVLAKGNYFSYAGRPAFSRLVYPTPMPGGLGVARHARHGRTHALRPRRRVDRPRGLRGRPGAAPRSSTRASAPIGRACRTIR